MALARYEGVAQDSAGNVIPNATVEVRRDQAGRPVVPLFSDRNGTVPMGNPITTNERGQFAFHVPGGVYYIRVFTGPSQAPFQEYTRRYQAVGTAAERDVEELASSLNSGLGIFSTTENLELFTPEASNVGARVLNDPDPSLNGDYIYVAGEWVRQRGLPDTLGRMEVVGGTANAVEAEIVNGVDPGNVVMLFIEPAETNTGAVTINGKPLKNIDGSALIIGQFLAGRSYFLTDEGTEYRLRQEGDVSGIPAGIAAAALAGVAAIEGSKDDAIAEIEPLVVTVTSAAEDVAEDRAQTGIDSAAAEAAKILAELAAQASLVSGPKYTSEAAGRAAVADGVNFLVQGQGDVAAYEYRRVSAGVVSPLIATYPSISAHLSALFRAGIASDYRHSDLLVLADGAKKIFGRVGLDAGWDILLSKIATTSGLKIELYEVHGEFNAPIVVVDAANKILFSGSAADIAAEVSLSRGTKASLGERLATHLSPAGVVKLPALFTPFMRRCHQKLMNRALGEAAQLNIGLVGDSFTHNYDRWSGPLATYLASKFGDAGGGWTGYGFQFPGATPYVIGGTQPTGKNGNARPATYTLDLAGTWIVTYNNSPSPDLSHVTSSTAGDQIKQTWGAAPAHTAIELFWIGTADGVVRYRLNGGALVNLNVQGTVDALSSQQIALPGGTTMFEVEVVSGTVKLAGSNLISTASGVRVHKLAGGGARLSQWNAQNAAYQQSGWAKLGIHAFSIMDGTNSQGAGDVASVWKGRLSTMIDRMRAAVPFPDIAIVVPPENGLARPILMSDYASAARELAYEKSTAYRDLQPDFGVNVADYLFSSAYPLMDADNTHPTSATGGRLILAAMIGIIVPAGLN